MRAKLADIVAITRQSDQMCAVAQSLRDAQRNVATTDQEHALHRHTGATKAPIEGQRAQTSRDPVQEPSIPKPTQPR